MGQVGQGGAGGVEGGLRVDAHLSDTDREGSGGRVGLAVRRPANRPGKPDC
jgi:hypothetical protein